MVLKDAQSSGYINELRSLYEAAFPEDEKKDFNYMLGLRDEGKLEMLAIDDDGEFAGLIINLLSDSNTVLLDYFAVSPDKRSSGIGGRALKLLLDRITGKKLIFAIEMHDDNALNAEDRRRRKSFYLKNGIKETGVFVNVYNTDFELLTNDGKLSYEDYISALKNSMGDRVDRILKPRKLF